MCCQIKPRGKDREDIRLNLRFMCSNVLSDHAELQILNGSSSGGKENQNAELEVVARWVCLLPVGDRADGIVARQVEGSDPREGAVPLEREEVLAGAGDDAPVARDEGARQDPPWRTSCNGSENRQQPRPCHHGEDPRWPGPVRHEHEETGRGLLPFPAAPPAPSRRQASRHRGHGTPTAMAWSACCAR